MELEAVTGEKLAVEVGWVAGMMELVAGRL